MTKTIKIIIGVSVVLIIAVAGWWIWNQIYKPIKQGPTCDEKCKSLGYLSGKCRNFSTFDESKKCKDNEISIGSTLDCVNVTLVVGVDTTCCCKLKEDETAKKTEREIQTGKIKIDYKEMERVRKSVDEGHEPWRLNPIMVIMSEARQYRFTEDDFDKTLTDQQERIKELGPDITEVQVGITHKGKIYIITLIQPFPEKSKIWTISEIKAK